MERETLIEVLAVQLNEQDKRITRHKEEIDAHLENTDSTVSANAEELLKIRFWRERTAGVLLVLAPASGILTAIILHFIEKALKP